MKPISLILVLCCYIMISCNNNNQNSISDKKDQYEEAFNESEKLKEEASINPEFAKSNEYSKQMERASIEMAKNQSLNQSDKLLLEFELALKSLKQNTDQLKQNPKLTKDLSFLEKTQVKADKVREYQQLIKKLNLNPNEKKKFDDLCRQ